MVPDTVQTVLDILRQNGFTAVLVGGCVRDACMGLVPHDFDIATSAAPEQIRHCFADFRTLDTGIRHGTVTVLVDHTPVEVTTFRIDGETADHRHPQGVTFTTDLEADLARRDFTVNAMAMDGDTLIDPFGGLADLRARTIRCVGDADRRFDEDGLRILRAMRFAAVLSFSVAPDTAAAIHRCKALLRCISAERIWAELRRLLTGDNAPAVLTEFADVLRVFLPEADENGLCRLAQSPPRLTVRLALLLQSADAAHALRLLRADKKTVHAVISLLAVQPQPTRRMLSAYPPQTVLDYWDYAYARGTCTRNEADERQREIRSVLAQAPCLHIRDLAVNGSDLSALGLQGAQIGHALRFLLDAVLDGKLPNEKHALLRAIQ